jgi:RNA polymerase sigma factor (sigma-70 family)
MEQFAREPRRTFVNDRWESIWQHRNDLLKLARARVPSVSDAEDVVHEAMTLAAADPNVELARAGAWLNRVVRNRCADLARERSYADKCVIYEQGRARIQPLTEEVVCDNAEARFLAQMLERLPSRQHEALMHASDGLSNAQIAAAMSTTVKAIESLLVKARRTLRLAAVAAVAGLAFVFRRSPRSATSAASLVALTVGLSVYSLNSPAPGEHRTAPRLALRPEVVTTGLTADTVHKSATASTSKQRVPSHKRPPASVQFRPHDPSVEIKAGPTDTKVSGHQYGPVTDPVPDTMACLRGGVIVSKTYIGCRNNSGNN